jgi:hypothetical protein
MEVNQPAPWRTARRSAAGELPATRIGGTSAPGERVIDAPEGSSTVSPLISPGRSASASSVRRPRSAQGTPTASQAPGAVHDPVRADAEHDPAARDVLQRRDLLGGPGGMAQGEDHHAEAELDALGDAGRGREHDHALRVGAGRLEVVSHEDAVEAEPLGVPGLLGRVRRSPVGAGVQHHPDLQPAAHVVTGRAVELQDLHAGGR